MDIAITGSSGWLGRYLVNSLVKGNPDYSEDKTYSKLKLMDVVVPKENTDKYVYGNVTNYFDCLKLTMNTDVVVHTVGVIHPKKVKDFININVKGTDNMVRASLKNGVKKFIYISSNSAVGIRDYVMTESTECIPYMMYGKSKLMAETLLHENSGNGMDIIILRPCWFYGEGQPDRQTKLFKMIKKGKPMIFGDGNNLRSMTYIGNLCHAISLSIVTEDYGKYFPEVYWITDSIPYTTNQIYDTIAGLLDVSDYKPRHIPSISCSMGRLIDRALQKIGKYNSYMHVLGEMDQNIACNINKATKDLNYIPKISLTKGMTRSIEWCFKEGKL